jgi:hypothetical protein
LLIEKVALMYEAGRDIYDAHRIHKEDIVAMARLCASVSSASAPTRNGAYASRVTRDA